MAEVLCCERCGSMDIEFRYLEHCNQLRYRCRCCRYSRAVQQEHNAKKRDNTSLNNWAKHIRKRYDGCCVICGSQDGVEAHHIVPVSHCEDLKYEVNNGVLLCRKHHRLVHYKDRNQMEEPKKVE